MTEGSERMLQAALQLFARDGYAAVSVRAIAASLGMTKSALYKHFRSKRDLFDRIVAHMEQQDAQRAAAYTLPCVSRTENAAAYQQADLSQIIAYAKAQFRYWTEDAFASCFRKLLTLEQYRDPAMATLYQQYLASGPVQYLSDLFLELVGDRAQANRLAVRFYAPMYLLFASYDNGVSPAALQQTLTAQWDAFAESVHQLQAQLHICQTARLTLLPLNAAQLTGLLADLPAFEQSLDCHYAAEPLIGGFREIVEGQVPLVECDGADYVWDTFWLMIRKEDRTVVGAAVWKGKPNAAGVVEIGYGCGAAFTRKGYMTEALTALCAWAWRQPSVRRIVAETECDNVASQALLRRCGFVLASQEETMWWQMVQPMPPTTERKDTV